MKVKLINEALKRVVLPEPELHTVAAVEAFKAGVRALAYELEKDTTPDYTGDMLAAFKEKLPPGKVMPCMRQTLPQQLSDLIGKVFDNEENFRTSLLPEDAIGLEEFYMASERCYVMYLNENIEVYTTIKTADFLAWVEGLYDGESGDRLVAERDPTKAKKPMTDDGMYGTFVFDKRTFQLLEEKHFISGSTETTKFMCANPDETAHLESLGAVVEKFRGTVVCDWYKIILSGDE